MTSMSLSEVEEWLDSNPHHAHDYFLRKAELGLINKWLVLHGFLSIRDYVSSRRGSASYNSANNSPGSPRSTAENAYSGVGGESGGSSDPGDSNNGSQHRSNSKKYLRQDFAKSKNRSVFRTCEPASLPTQSDDTQNRRSSLKDMRKYLSLPPNSINILSLLIESRILLPKYPSMGRDSKRELRHHQNEREFFLDIVKDIANDLDLKSITHKIIVNLTVLLEADGASLFFVESSRGKQTLVSKVFDVHCGTNILPTASNGDNEIQVPWGKGIIGHVAETGESVNLINASQDPRYNDEVDRITGYRTESLLCMPVKNAYDEIIAVAQVINKITDEGICSAFNRNDEKLLETYLQFVGIAITNAQIFETSAREYERNRNLLEVVHDLFEEQISLEKVILKTMQRAQRLLKCERAAVLLLQENHEVNSSPKKNPECSMSEALLRLAEQVASTGEVLNIAEYLEIEKTNLGTVKSLLCMPIRNRDFQIIGVAKIINKLNGQPFDENDEQLFEAFTIFCGLGINNTMMFNEMEKAMAKQRVAIEVLSYHATIHPKEIEKLKDLPIPDADEWGLHDLSFDDFCLSQEEMILAAVAMFKDLGLINRFNIQKETLLRWLMTVRKNYRDVPYHNWRHAFNVAQMMFALFTTAEMKGIFTDIERLGMFTGCLCHDLDHRGKNNAFQEKTGSALALLYGTTNTMEHHHFNHAVMILNSEGHCLFSNLSSDSFSKVMNVLKHSILSTDLSVYFQNREKFFSLIHNNEYDWQTEGHRELLLSMLMTACDIAASTKPWSVQQKVAELVTSEFFDQGDIEKQELNIQPQALMDRDRKHELPQLQISWIEDICLPLYKNLTNLNSRIQVMVDGAIANKNKWAELASDEGMSSQSKERETTVVIYCSIASHHIKII
uniref:Phosphodiesterase n=1 Tax=Strigamia maritima TaxID=126957 RepID=T1JG26_STRMM